MPRAPSIGYQVRKILGELNGIGESKRDCRREHAQRSIESQHLISPKIHSMKSMENIRRELTDLGRFAKQNYGMKHLERIDSSVVRSWLKQKDIGYRTASNYLSDLNKVSSYLDITREEIREIRKELSPILPRPKLETRAYKNIDKLQVPERIEPAFRLQRDYGLRPGAAVSCRIVENPKNLHTPDGKYTHLKGNVLHYREKGGRMSQKVINKGTIASIQKNAQNGKFEVHPKAYSRAIKKVIEKDGQKFNGVHGIRHNFAQKAAETKTLLKVSQEMGHVREEITHTYLR
jgi:integrase